MKKSNSHQQTVRLVQIALMAAIVVVIQLFFAAVKIGPVTIAFSLVPIVLTGIFIGPFAGLIVGAISGIVTFIQVLTSPDVFYVFLISTNPWATALICFAKATFAGWLPGVAHKATKDFIKEPALNSILPSIICPVVNTGIFCLGMFVFFTDALKSDATFGAAASDNIIYFVIVVLALANFILELISTVVITPIISKALTAAKVFKK